MSYFFVLQFYCIRMRPYRSSKARLGPTEGHPGNHRDSTSNNLPDARQRFPTRKPWYADSTTLFPLRPPTHTAPGVDMGWCLLCSFCRFQICLLLKKKVWHRPQRNSSYRCMLRDTYSILHNRRWNYMPSRMVK